MEILIKLLSILIVIYGIMNIIVDYISYQLQILSTLTFSLFSAIKYSAKQCY